MPPRVRQLARFISMPNTAEKMAKEEKQDSHHGASVHQAG